MNNKKTVVVAMSGGVDSSTACFLLKNEGYRVIGVTLKLWEPHCEIEKTSEKSCCSPDDLTDARKIASQLKIPYYVLNLENEFKKHVIDYFCSEYFTGKTPSPCILCNQKIKFELLLKKVQTEFNADFLATGHYAQISYNQKFNEYELHKGIDPAKDQSYFLWGLNQVIMPFILFPVGKYTKKEIRSIAKEASLVVADKHESQEICFIPDNNYGKFLSDNKNYKPKEGNIVDINNKVLGKHTGLHLYTVGQRKGLGISNPTPLYVIKIDIENNLLVVGDDVSLYNNKLLAKDIIWSSGEKPETSINIKAKIRSKSPEAEAILYPIENSEAEMVFSSPQRAITPGQSVVFYINDKIIGGGWIK